MATEILRSTLRGNISDWRVALLVSPHFWKQGTNEPWVLKVAWNVMIISNCFHFYSHIFYEFCIFLHSNYRKDFVVRKQYVSAGISTLMFFSDGLGPSIFCRNFEWTRPSREDLDEKVFVSRQNCHFCFEVLLLKVIFPICLLTWHVYIYVCRQEKGMNRRNESTKWRILVLMIITGQFSFFLRSFFKPLSQLMFQ